MPDQCASKPPARNSELKRQTSFRTLSKKKKSAHLHFRRTDRPNQAGPSSLTQMIRKERAKQLETDNRRTVRIKPQVVTESHPKSPTRAAMPGRSILKNPAGGEINGLLDEYRPAITVEEKKYSYKPDQVPIMQTQRAITTISIPKHFTVKPKTGLLAPKWAKNRSTSGEKQRWERNVFLSDCGQFVIIHEYPVYDWRTKLDIMGTFVMGSTTLEKSKIVIYRTFAKVSVRNEDLPQFDYGRTRERVIIPGMEEHIESEGPGSNAPYYFSVRPKQSQWASDPQIVAEWNFPPNEIVSQVKVSMDVGKGGDGNV